MTIFKFKKSWLEYIKNGLSEISKTKFLVLIAFVLSFLSIIYTLTHDIILAYGDAQSHINISKRAVDSITPGFAQLGGVWLPLPHF